MEEKERKELIHFNGMKRDGKTGIEHIQISVFTDDPATGATVIQNIPVTVPFGMGVYASSAALKGITKDVIGKFDTAPESVKAQAKIVEMCNVKLAELDNAVNIAIKAKTQGKLKQEPVRDERQMNAQ